MIHPKVTREAVFSAADAQRALNKNPSCRSIMLALGGGSMRDVSRYLSEWRQLQENDQEALNALEVPVDVQLHFKRLYWSIQTAAEANLAAETVAAIEEENLRLKEDMADYHAVKAKLEGMDYALSSMRQYLDQQIRENERNAKFSPLAEQMEAIAAERDELKIECDRLAEKVGDLDLAKSHLAEQLDGSEKNLKAAQDRANEMAERLYYATTENEKNNGKLTQLAERNIELTNQKIDLEAALVEKLNEIEEMKTEYFGLKLQRDKLQSLLNKENRTKEETQPLDAPPKNRGGRPRKNKPGEPAAPTWEKASDELLNDLGTES